MRKMHPAIGIPGLSSLMVIFAVLCISVFSVLSISTALAGKRLAETSSEAVYAFYKADCEAEKTLALLRNGEIPANVERNNNNYVYFVPVSDSRSVRVEVSVDGKQYDIHSWNTVYTNEWNADETIDVWVGEKVG